MVSALSVLRDYCYRYLRKMKLLGSPGADIDVKAPLGVTVLTDEGDVLADLTAKGQTITIAQG